MKIVSRSMVSVRTVINGCERSVHYNPKTGRASWNMPSQDGSPSIRISGTYVADGGFVPDEEHRTAFRRYRPIRDLSGNNTKKRSVHYKKVFAIVHPGGFRRRIQVGRRSAWWVLRRNGRQVHVPGHYDADLRVFFVRDPSLLEGYSPRRRVFKDGKHPASRP